MNQDLIDRERRETYSRKQREKYGIIRCVHLMTQGGLFTECGRRTNAVGGKTRRLDRVTCLSCLKAARAMVEKLIRPLWKKSEVIRLQRNHVKREALRKRNHPKGCGRTIKSPHGTKYDRVCGSAKYPYDPVMCGQCL